MILQPALQRHTLRLYGELLCRETEWGGRLTFAAFSGAGCSGLAAASSLAGAASLCVDHDAQAVKENFRDGAFDFVVNTLDEALRALKNEIRQKRPLAIALIGDPEAVEAEAESRGLAPRLVLTQSSVAPLQAAYKLSGGLDPSPELEVWLSMQAWSEAAVPNDPTGRALLDRVACEDSPRARWVRELSTHQRSIRTADRWCWLTPAELTKVGREEFSPAGR